MKLTKHKTTKMAKCSMIWKNSNDIKNVNSSVQDFQCIRSLFYFNAKSGYKTETPKFGTKQLNQYENKENYIKTRTVLWEQIFSFVFFLYEYDSVCHTLYRQSQDYLIQSPISLKRPHRFRSNLRTIVTTNRRHSHNKKCTKPILTPYSRAVQKSKM